MIKTIVHEEVKAVIQEEQDGSTLEFKKIIKQEKNDSISELRKIVREELQAVEDSQKGFFG